MGLNFFYTAIFIFLFQGLCLGQNPKYYSDSIQKFLKLNAHNNSAIDSLWSYPEFKLSLSGKKQSLAIWEAGEYSHPDVFNPKWKDKLFVGDHFRGTSYHAGQIADIIFSPPEKNATSGIAFNAQGVFFDTYDFWKEFGVNCPEFSTSLHCYARDPGWLDSYPKKNSLFWGGLEEVSSYEDYNFGFYNDETRLWDSVLVKNPNHLAIKAAGNSRGQKRVGLHYFYRSRDNSTQDYYLDSSKTKRSPDGSDSGYDGLPSAAVSKNVLVVGAAEPLENKKIISSLILPSEGSSYGPTDDGRIKPDLVAFGENTSQSAAYVAGAVLLLQEHYVNLFGEQASSDVMKCILIHTTDDIGKYKGPDYKMGWGLINSNRAARFISASKKNRSLLRGELENGDSIRLFYLFKKGQRIKLSLVWNDIEGVPLEFENDPSMLNNPKQMLVNDLDLRITELATGCKSLPYVLNPNQPERPAKNADNFRDNVESITWRFPMEGWYEISVNHKGKIIGDSQKFALAISGVEHGFAFDGKEWYPHKPNEKEFETPILILKGVDFSTFPNGEKFKNLHFE